MEPPIHPIPTLFRLSCQPSTKEGICPGKPGFPTNTQKKAGSLEWGEAKRALRAEPCAGHRVPHAQRARNHWPQRVPGEASASDDQGPGAVGWASIWRPAQVGKGGTFFGTKMEVGFPFVRVCFRAFDWFGVGFEALVLEGKGETTPEHHQTIQTSN